MAINSQSVFGASSAAASTSTDSSKTSSSRTKLAEDMDTFLTMLTTQLKNQDPLSPMDSTEFTNQLVEFAQVEQAINSNQNLESLVTLQKTNALTQAVGYIGTDVKAESDKLSLQDGESRFTYLLSEKADKVTIHVKDANGTDVRKVELSNVQVGEHEGAWDGTSTSGAKMADGSYKIVVEYEDEKGAKHTAKTATIGRVTGVSSADGATMLSLGSADVALDKVITVVEGGKAKTTQTTAATSSTSTGS